MPIKADILAERGLIYFKFSGYVTVGEALASMEAITQKPEFRVGMKHFVDFQDVTDYERDYVKVLELQAKVADHVIQDEIQTLLVLLATTPQGREMANINVRSWEGVTTVVPVIAETEKRALELLGEPETRIADLLANAL